MQLFISFKLYIRDSNFAHSAILLRRWRLVLNINFVYFTFFWFFYKINLSIFRNSCLEFVQLIHLEFVRNLSCPEFVQFICTNSGHEKISGKKVDHFLGHFLDIHDNFQIFSGHILYNFRTFLFYRDVMYRTHKTLKPERLRVPRPLHIQHSLV